LKIDLLTNTDAFLSYLRSYFFFDYDLIAILLDDELHETAIVQAVGQHLQRRIVRLTDPPMSALLAIQSQNDGGRGVQDIFRENGIETLSAAVADWDTNDQLALNPSRVEMYRTGTVSRKASISGLDAMSEPVKGILVDPTRAAETQKRLLATYDWLLEEDDEPEELSIIKRIAFRQINYRTLLVLCGWPVQAVIEDGHCAVVWDGGKITMAAASAAVLGAHTARLEIAVSSRIIQPMAFVWGDERLIGAGLPSELSGMLQDPAIGKGLGAFESHKFIAIFE
jgi:hypothetical protein